MPEGKGYPMIDVDRLQEKILETIMEEIEDFEHEQTIVPAGIAVEIEEEGPLEVIDIEAELEEGEVEMMDDDEGDEFDQRLKKLMRSKSA
jgi:hypothetical protein